MKRLLIVAIWIISISCATESSVDPAYKDYFIKYYGGDGNQEARDFVLNTDGSVVMVGVSITALGNRLYLVKADAEGNILFAKETGTLNEDVKDIDVFQAGPHAGSYMVLTNVSRPGGGTDIKVVVIDQNGNSVDSVMYKARSTQYGNGITALPDGGFIVTGNTDRTALPLDNDPAMVGFEDEADIISLRYNLNLIKDGIWNESFGDGEPYAMGVKIIPMGDNKYLYAGYTNADPEGGGLFDNNFLFVILGANGLNISDPIYVGHPRGISESMTAVARSQFGRFMAVGTAEEVGSKEIFSTVITPTVDGEFNVGSYNFAELLSDDSQSESVDITTSQNGNNEFWFLGNEVLPSGRNILVAKVNDRQKTLFSMSFGGPNNDDTGSAILEAPNGDVLILGTMTLVNQTKMALIKVRPNGSFK